MPIEITCDTCGSKFLKKPSHVRKTNFCCMDCLNNWRTSKTTVQCTHCGKPVIKTSSELRQHNFCDRTCSSKWRSENVIGYKHSRYYLKPRPCQRCGELFKPSQNIVKYCSKQCGYLSMRKRVEVTCRMCNKAHLKSKGDVEWSIKRGNKHFFCSKNCSAMWHKKENSPRWIEDRSKLKNQHKTLRESTEMKEWRNTIFTRDNWTCQLCKNKSAKDNKVKLNAHHIRRFMDRPDLRFDSTNGITLCEQCHKRTYGKEAEYEAILLSMISGA